MDGGKVVLRRTALFLRADQLERLAQISEETGAAIAWLVRKAIDEYLKNEK